MQPDFPRLFTVEEANGLLPKLKELLADVSVHRDAMREKAPHMEPILRAAGSNGGGRIGSEYGVEAYRLYLAIEAIREEGVLLKDLDTGLLDFPHERGGRVVFLCWHPPEEDIRFWHEIEAGYPGRQPL
ncbi:MAG: hypothetical protein AVDCRST_MAG02-846 [uncultured Rubrobacteraceae bacterium]|uniref:DUF2203 domain-containing protein n=1 Tax=uncultured Rubrobacteraceae bacterium TaxID=349277 RepID=A0A6J4QS96_9ACTN|nr:MAG: hypothetical protein AVDCRST_MAG02-846 [uncultured Rubrobacteraceae bacterium]